MSANRDDWCTAEEAADLTGRSVHTIWRWVRIKKVRAIRPRRIRLLLKADVMKVEAEMSK